jgi:hypothetical protein
MDATENSKMVELELLAFAKKQGTDLSIYCVEGFGFQNDLRFICLWRRDERPGSGSPDEPYGLLRYSMQGDIKDLPIEFIGSVKAFQGAWCEAGSFESIEQAYYLVKAWIIDRAEVDQLPARRRKRYGIGG